MVQVRDTFLHYLADNLPGKTIHYRRFDVNDPNALALVENAINVEFFDISPEVAVSTQRVALDVIFTDERTAVAAMTAVWGVLVTHQTPLMDYSNPASPVATGSNLMWSKVSFKRVTEQNYCHYLCLLTLQYHL
jgi:hypothetical protein